MNSCNWTYSREGQVCFGEGSTARSAFKHSMNYRSVTAPSCWAESNTRVVLHHDREAFTSAFKELDPIPQFKATAKLASFLELATTRLN